jgi:hypothetical protein
MVEDDSVAFSLVIANLHPSTFVTPISASDPLHLLRLSARSRSPLSINGCVSAGLDDLQPMFFSTQLAYL